MGNATLDDWHQELPMSSRWECCEVCRATPECHVANFAEWRGTNQGKISDWNITGGCWMRGRINTSMPTTKANVTACLVASRPTPPAAPPAHARNVLYIVSDDMRPQLPVYGQRQMITPHFDRLAARSLTFSRAYCQQSICSPSRNSFMTSMRPDRTGVFNFVNDFRDHAEGAAWTTLPQYFKQHNYTALGHSKLFHWGHPERNDEPLSWSQEQPYVGQQGAVKQPKGCGYFDVCPGVPENSTIDFVMVDAALRTLRRAAAEYTDAAVRKPFFLGVGLIRPHLPFIVPQDKWDLYDESTIAVTNNTTPPRGAPAVALNDCIFANANWSFADWAGTHPGENATFHGMGPHKPYPPAAQRFLRHGYYAAVSHIDAQLGRMLDALDELGVANDTIIAFHGDHGWHLGEQGEWTKKTEFELGTRVPLLIAAPHLPQSAGRVSAELAELVDVYPTLAALAGLPPPPGLDGVSLAPAFETTGGAVAVEAAPPAQPIKRYAFSQFPQCPVDPSGQRYPLWHYADSCQGFPRETIPYFGYSVRSDGWRYTEWRRFRCPDWEGGDCAADWDGAPIGVELYDHRGHGAGVGVERMMPKFDSFDVRNVASDPSLAPVVRELSAVLRQQFNSTSHLSATVAVGVR
eukprot:g7299.t1